MKRTVARARWRAVWLVFLVLLVLLPGACGQGEGAARRASERAAIRIAVVTHGQAGDPFWSVVKNGVDRAAKDMGVKVTYDAPQTFDMVAMSRLIDAQVARKPDGLIVSVPDAAALSRSIRAAVAAGIPVITVNAGGASSKELGALMHVGQAEYDAGRAAGERMAAAGVRGPICVNHEIGNASLDQRCQGFLDAIAKAGGAGRVLAVNAANPTDAQQKIMAATTPGVDGVFTLGALGARAATAALGAQGKAGKILLATFDLSPDVLAGIRDGAIAFAVDQQPYLQGYLPVVLLTQYKLYGVLPAGGAMPTGPAFVTKDEAARVIDWSKEGIR